MKKTTLESRVRMAYEAPSVQTQWLQAENHICSASQEGFGDESDYQFVAPADMIDMSTLGF